MTLLLSWETPPELYDAKQSAYAVEICRKTPEPGAPSQTVGGGQQWGFYEDVGNTDPSYIYTIRYTDMDGAVRQVINDTYIRRWRRPTNTCRIDFLYTRPDSAPWTGRRMKLCDLPLHHWVRDLWCDHHGKAHIVLEWGQHVRLEVEGFDRALEFAVPRLHTLEAGDLEAYGSWVRADARATR